jgi:hypothetical protein
MQQLRERRNDRERSGQVPKGRLGAEFGLQRSPRSDDLDPTHTSVWVPANLCGEPPAPECLALAGHNRVTEDRPDRLSSVGRFSAVDLWPVLGCPPRNSEFWEHECVYHAPVVACSRYVRLADPQHLADSLNHRRQVPAVSSPELGTRKKLWVIQRRGEVIQRRNHTLRDADPKRPAPCHIAPRPRTWNWRLLFQK